MTTDQIDREIVRLRLTLAATALQPFDIFMHALQLDQAARLEAELKRREEEDRLLQPYRVR